MPAPDRFRYFGEMWKKLPTEEKENYRKKEEEVRKDYEEALERYESECPAERKFKDQLRSRIKTKKPPNAYTLFVQTVAESLKKDNPKMQWKEILGVASQE